MDPANLTTILSQEITIELFNDDGTTTWMEHPISGHLVDVAVIKIGALLDQYEKVGINVVADTYDMSISLGDNVVVMGYPLGFTHFIDTPIWKHGIVASEPRLETENSRRRIVIDATTREGMSGSPVLRLESTTYLNESGEICRKARASRLIGVYASRPTFREENVPSSEKQKTADSLAEIGYVYKSGVIDEIIVGTKHGPREDEIPA
jgi:hypothetical protein